MATQSAVKPVAAHHITAKQLAADKANLKKARAAQKGKPRTAKQKAASRQNLVKARAAQKARRAGKKFVTKKQAQAPDSRETSAVPTGQNIHLIPSCAAVALAEHLHFWTGTAVPEKKILELHGVLGGGALITDVFEAAAELSFCGFRPDTWTRCDVSTEGVTGLIYGLTVTAGYHAALAVPGGMLSWGLVLPWPGEPEEAWHLEWVPLS
jgi:hypothetical protein